MIATNREVGLFIGDSSKEAQTLLPSSCHQLPIRLSAQEGHE